MALQEVTEAMGPTVVWLGMVFGGLFDLLGVVDTSLEHRGKTMGARCAYTETKGLEMTGV